MEFHRKRMFVIMILVSLSGCTAVHKPTNEQISSADYGRFPDDYQQIVKDSMKKTLFDPYSAVYDDWRGPAQGYIYSSSGSYFGYRVCVEINSKNRMGGYVGSRPFHFLIKNNQVLSSEGGYRPGTIGYEEVKKLCNL